MTLLPVALYGVEVPPGEIMIPAAVDFPATIRITMAAIDPTEDPEPDEEGNVPRVPRSTLKIIKERVGSDDSDDEDEDDSYLQELIANAEEDSEDSEDEDDEPNGGPSDPSKSKKARAEAAIKKLIDAAQKEEDSDEDMAEGETNGIKSKKGKAPATDDDDEDSDEESDSDEGLDLESHVICTLDVERYYQQPLDIVIGENEKAYFIVTGTHAVHLTGNYVMPPDEDEDEDEDEYDLTPELEDLMDGEGDVSSDDLDGIEHTMRVEEIDTDEEQVPKLVKASKKGKKRPAEDEAEGLDELIAKESKAEAKLSKKQQKKLKNNKGEAVSVEDPKAASTAKEASATAKGDKKVQFAKNLEQGPTGSAENAKAAKKPSLGVKVVQGVTIDDRKLGSGRAAKSGDKVSMRYIGKLQNGKVFDANKKGPPFSFKLGKGEVIKGWDIGVAGMTVGGERRLTIPASLAYGSSGTSGIPGNSTLIFDVKLLEIK